MNERATNLSIDELLRHGAFVRALARRLVTDDATADDVVQEVWLRALEHPPAHRGSLTGWLARVARNFVRDRVSSEGAREQREQRVSRERNDHEPLDTEQRSGMVEAIASAFAGLPASYRDALYLRFYEDRSPVEIAKQLDCPLATVKTRLARGIELLRRSLEQRARERGESLSSLITGLVALQAHAKPAGVTLTSLGGALLMKKLVALVILACGASWWMWRARVSDIDVLTAVDPPNAEVVQAPRDASASESGATGEVLQLPARDTRLLAEPPVRIHVFDEARARLSSVKAELVTDREVVFLGSTDVAGGLEIQPPPKSAARLVFSLAGFAVREVPPPKPDQRDLEVVLERGGTISGRVVEYNIRLLPAAEQEPIAGARVVAWDSSSGVRGRAAFDRLQLGDPSIRFAVSDANGEFAIDGLPVGRTYFLRAGAPGLIQNVNEMRASSSQTGAPVVPASNVLVELQHGYSVAFQLVDDASGAVVPYEKFSARMTTGLNHRSAQSIPSGGLQSFLAGLDPRLLDPESSLIVCIACSIEPLEQVGPFNLDAQLDGYDIAKVEAPALPLTRPTPIMTVAVHQTAKGFGTVALQWIATNGMAVESGPAPFPPGLVNLVGDDGSIISLLAPVQVGMEHVLRRVPVGNYRATVTANGNTFVHPTAGVPPLTIRVEADKQATIRVPLEQAGSIELRVDRAGVAYDKQLQFRFGRGTAPGGNFLTFSNPPYRILPVAPGTYSIEIINLSELRRDSAFQPAPVVVTAGAESTVHVRIP